MIKDKEQKRILITGGSGFIGGALIRKLLIETNHIIFNLDKMGYASDLTSIKDTLEKIDHKRAKDYSNLQINLSNQNDTNKAILKSDPDIVFHLAAESHVDRSIHNPSIFIDSNITGTFNLLEACRSHFSNLDKYRKKIFKFLHISTDEVFGSLGNTGYFCEKTPYSPQSPYSASKAASDHLVKAWHNTYNFPSIVTNCSNNFGPWQYPEKLIPLVILKVIKNESIPVYGKGNNIRDWLYVDDHIEALLTVSTKGKNGESYCIGTNQEKTNLEIVENICNILNEIRPSIKDYKSLISFVKDRAGHDYRYAIDSTKIKNDLGWQAKNDFSTNLFNTVNWYLCNLEWCFKFKKK
tara:strand:- start:326 stop:1381 length:1056 start_codon:yes stop_codon:yes gene_type:complete